MSYNVVAFLLLTLAVVLVILQFRQPPTLRPDISAWDPAAIPLRSILVTADGPRRNLDKRVSFSMTSTEASATTQA